MTNAWRANFEPKANDSAYLNTDLLASCMVAEKWSGQRPEHMRQQQLILGWEKMRYKKPSTVGLYLFLIGFLSLSLA